MITNIIYYNNYFYGVFISENIMSDINCLNELIHSLDRNNAELISLNTEGVIIKYKDCSLIDSAINDTYLLKQKIIDLEEKINNISKESQKEITKDFFILFDFLPEHIKKELKIYVKNDK